MIEIQSAMARRAVELLGLPENRPQMVLDLGCGSGLSGEVLTDLGHIWVGQDISASMLGVAIQRDVEGDLIHGDMGQGIPMRPGTFDAAISISALQWLLNADHKHHEPWHRLLRFFQTLYNCLRRGSRAVFQLYPETPRQMEMITSAAMRCGFGGGVLIDYPNSTKAKKFYLVLAAGVSDCPLPQALGTEVDESSKNRIRVNASITPQRRRKQQKGESRKEKIVRKKERARMQGKKVPLPSKYTARRRPNGF